MQVNLSRKSLRYKQSFEGSEEFFVDYYSLLLNNKSNYVREKWVSKIHTMIEISSSFAQLVNRATLYVES